MRTRLKEFRARYNLTQDELARKVGVRRETILYMESGKYVPSLKLAHDVAKVLKVSIEELFSFEDEENPVVPVPAPVATPEKMSSGPSSSNCPGT